MIQFLRFVCLLTLISALVLPAGAADKDKKSDKEKKPKTKKKANKLARESSPYLLQHAHNPVNWYPWGPEAFAKAKKEKKLIFLSIGYSSCHWCHVMEKESFANEDVAKMLNENFVCIKVDREERPDVDQIYMAALQVMQQRGGWPLSMFLDDEGRPIYGGTYFPREDKEEDGKTYLGFKGLCKFMLNLKKRTPKKLSDQAETVAKRTVAVLSGFSRGAALVTLDQELLTGIVDSLKEEFDKPHGGFGSAERKFRGPKFPMSPTLVFLQGEARRTKSKDAVEMLDITLDHMARGGIFDHLGGGFHRYTVERTWTVPHFEKMLYDNAQLLEVYAEAYRTTRKPYQARVLRQTIAWLDREMTSPEGAFYSALDADSEGEEGKFYIWTAKEYLSVLKDKKERTLFSKVYGIEDGFNFEGRYHIFRLTASLEALAKEQKTTEEKLEETLAKSRKKFFDLRARRPRPLLDNKVLTAWNGQMIAGLARAGQALGDKTITAKAAKAAEFLLKNMKTKDGRLLRSWAAAPGEKAKARLAGYLDDYAFLVHGLLTLHDVTGEKKWLDEAKTLTATMIKYHEDTKAGGFFYTANDHEKLFARAKDSHDGAQPSGNSVAAHNLVRLWIKTKDDKYKKLAAKTTKAFAAALKLHGTSHPMLAEAVGLMLQK